MVDCLLGFAGWQWRQQELAMLQQGHQEQQHLQQLGEHRHLEQEVEEEADVELLVVEQVVRWQPWQIDEECRDDGREESERFRKWLTKVAKKRKSAVKHVGLSDLRD